MKLVRVEVCRNFVHDRNQGCEMNLSLDETGADAGETGTLLPDDDHTKHHGKRVSCDNHITASTIHHVLYTFEVTNTPNTGNAHGCDDYHTENYSQQMTVVRRIVMAFEPPNNYITFPFS